MDDKTVKTGSGGADRRFLTRHNVLFVSIFVGVILIAGGVGILVRTIQNRHDKGAQTTVTGPSLPQTVSDVQDLRLNGDTAAANKKIDEALNDKNTSSSDRYLLYMQKAAGLNDQKNYTAAADAYAQATSLKQTSDAYDALGDTYAAAGQKDKAADAYKKALALVQDSPVQADNKAVLQHKIDNLESGQ